MDNLEDTDFSEDRDIVADELPKSGMSSSKKDLKVRHINLNF